MGVPCRVRDFDKVVRLSGSELPEELFPDMSAFETVHIGTLNTVRSVNFVCGIMCGEPVETVSPGRFQTVFVDPNGVHKSVRNGEELYRPGCDLSNEYVGKLREYVRSLVL